VQNASTTLPESLSGLIERTTFHNEAAGFGVLKIKAKGHRDLVTVVGSWASIKPVPGREVIGPCVALCQ
jgi:exodeoxyribonuclease V alpha subunit